MLAFSDWLPPAAVGLTFTILGSLKLVFDSCAPVFDVSPFAVGRGSTPSHFHSATSV
jgi:hypothetical protein